MVNVSVADTAAQNIDKASDSRVQIRFDIVPSSNDSIVHCFLNIPGHAQTRKTLACTFFSQRGPAHVLPTRYSRSVTASGSALRDLRHRDTQGRRPQSLYQCRMLGIKPANGINNRRILFMRFCGNSFYRFGSHLVSHFRRYYARRAR